jgi:hypothetical protein
VFEHLQAGEALVFADELDIHLLPQVGYAWMPKGAQVAVRTPGQNEKHSAGARDLATGGLVHCLGARKTNALFRDLPGAIATTSSARQYRRLYVVVDNGKIHKAKAVEQWLARQPRFPLLQGTGDIGALDGLPLQRPFPTFSIPPLTLPRRCSRRSLAGNGTHT